MQRRDLEDLETRVRETVSRKDETISALQKDVETTKQRMRNMEMMLRQLQEENTTHEVAD
jgi:hypothetical protein